MKIIDDNGIERECVSVILDKQFPGYVKAEFESKVRKDYKHSEWFPVDEFIKKNPGLKKTIGNAHDITEDLGAVSKAGENFIQDISKNWKLNMFAGTPIWISRGKGEGQQRLVTKNNKNTFYIDKKWKVTPDKSSQYVISFNVSKNIKAAGNTLPGIETKDMIEKLVKKARIR